MDAMLADLEKEAITEESLEEVDRRTAGAAFKKAAELFGFKTIEISGITYAHVGYLSRLLGYADISGLCELRTRHKIRTPRIGDFPPAERLFIRESFGLSNKDSRAILATWELCLAIAIRGRTSHAEKVKKYLLKMEREARIALDHITAPEPRQARLRLVENKAAE